MTPLEQGTLAFDQGRRTKVVLRGADAVAFLQGFCTNDVKQLPVGHGCEAFLLNVQGRIQAWLRIFKMPKELWLDADPGLGGKIVGHLEKYVITEDVAITDETEVWTQWLVTGKGTPKVLAAFGWEPLDADLSIASLAWGADRCQLRRNDALGGEGYDVLAPATRRAESMQALDQAGASMGAEGTYEYLRIQAGLPAYGTDVTEANLSQEVNRDARALSFTKGCYLGQEPVVRLRDLGHVNKKLMRLSVAGATVPASGSKLFKAGQEVGVVTSAALGPDGDVVALGYVRRSAWEPLAQLEVDVAGGKAPVVVMS